MGIELIQMPQKLYSVIIVANIERFRTEAEVWDEGGNRIGLVYEDVDGWHKELSHGEQTKDSAELATALSEAKQTLSQYVNRRGKNSPRGSTVGVLALWLMQKLDGTAMGQKVSFGSQDK